MAFLKNLVLSPFLWVIILSGSGMIGLLGFEIEELLNDLARVWEGGTRILTEA